MKKTMLAIGVVLGAVLLAAPAFARSIRSALENTLFGASQPIFLTVRNPAADPSNPNSPFPPDLVLLSADSNSKIFGRPIQTGGPGGIASQFVRGLSNNILTESAVIPLPSGSAGFEYTYNPSLNIFERTSIGLGAIFNERVNTLGKGVLALGAAYIRQDFDTFNGKQISKNNSIQSLLPGQSSSLFLETGEGGQSIIDATVKLDITTNTAALYGIYGLTEWIDVSLLLPLTEISLKAKSTLQQGSPTLPINFPAFLPDSFCGPERAQTG